MSTSPLAPGSVSLRVYPPSTAAATDIVEEMRAQAVVAERAGFDGLMTSEHHGGFPGYIPNPLQQAGWLLEHTEHIWAAPAPLLLPLRPWSHVAEEIAWLASRFPKRVGGGFAMGGLEADFELAGVPWSERLSRFEIALPGISAALRGEAKAPLSGDPAIAACADRPIPLVSAAQSPGAVRRAAACGLGVLFDSLQTAERNRTLVDTYRRAGGRQACIGIRRVWLGSPPTEQSRAQMSFYRSYASETAQRHWGDDERLVGHDSAELTDHLVSFARASGCEALNLRVHANNLPTAAVREQIERIGNECVPELRAELREAPTP